MMSDGSSTTHTVEGSRRSSEQIRQRGPSARLKQISHSPIRSFTSRIASASASASSSEARSRWKASRCAVRPPMPGSLPSSVTSRWTGGEKDDTAQATRPAGPPIRVSRGSSGRTPRLEPRQPEAAHPAARPAEAAGDAAELLRRQLLRRAQALVDSREHHVLKQLDVLRVDRLGVDRDRLDLQVPADLHGHHAAARRGFDDLVLQRLLRGNHVRLHLLDLLEHLLHVRLRHQAPPSSSISSSASNSATKRSTRSSSVGAVTVGAPAGSSAATTSRSS